MTAARFPSIERPSGQVAEWNRGPSKSFIPAERGSFGGINCPTALVTARQGRWVATIPDIGVSSSRVVASKVPTPPELRKAMRARVPELRPRRPRLITTQVAVHREVRQRSVRR